MARSNTPLHPAASALVALALFAAPATSSAQVAIGAQLAVGAAAPTGFMHDAAGTGPAVQAAITGSVPYTPIGVRGGLLYVALPGRGPNLDRTSFSAVNIAFTLKFDVGGVRPYVLVGPGFYYGHFDRTQTSVSDPIGDLKENSFLRGGFNAGGGVEFGHRRVRGFVEGTYHALRLENGFGEIVRPQFYVFSGGVTVELRKGKKPIKW